MNKDFEKDFNLGGNVDRALSGDYKLSLGEVFREAWSCTLKTFLSFSPAIVILMIVQLGIFYLALKMQLGDPGVIIDAIQNPDTFSQGIVQAIFVANFSYEVISAPIYAGVCLMAMSHIAGLSTKPRHIGKGLQHTVPVIIATLASLVLQGLAGMILPFLSMYVAVAFSQSILLICEKRVTPINSLLLSLRAVNKKLFVFIGAYGLVSLMFIVAVMFYGIGLIFVLPFFFHMKGILYREMFGIKLKIIASEKPSFEDEHNDNDNDQDGSNNSGKGSQYFDA